jgi:hypothetical protein
MDKKTQKPPTTPWGHTLENLFDPPEEKEWQEEYEELTKAAELMAGVLGTLSLSHIEAIVAKYRLDVEFDHLQMRLCNTSYPRAS